MEFKKKYLLIFLLELLAINCFTAYGVYKAVGKTNISLIFLAITCLVICIIMFIKQK